MNVAIGSDHAGFSLKKEVETALKDLGVTYEDFGSFNEDSCDYADFAKPVAQQVANGSYDRGILICGTGIGMSMTANKVNGIRCALVHDCFSAKATRQHNDANILAMGERVVGPGLAKEIVRTWFDTDFEGGRHQRRIDKIMELEERSS